MNKKIINITVGAISLASVVTPITANASSIDELNKIAYDAVKNLEGNSNQKNVNESRKAIINLKNFKLDSEFVISIVSTYSEIVDRHQQNILKDIVKSINNATDSLSQANINEAYSNLPIELSELEGSTNKDFWKNTYRSYSVAIDKLQGTLQSNLVDLINEGKKTGNLDVILKARKLAKEVLTSSKSEIVNWAKIMEERVEGLADSKEYEDLTIAILNAENVSSLDSILSLNKYILGDYNKENKEKYFNEIQAKKANLKTILDIKEMLFDLDSNSEIESLAYIYGLRSYRDDILEGGNYIDLTKYFTDASKVTVDGNKIDSKANLEKLEIKLNSEIKSSENENITIRPLISNNKTTAFLNVLDKEGELEILDGKVDLTKMGYEEFEIHRIVAPDNFTAHDVKIENISSYSVEDKDNIKISIKNNPSTRDFYEGTLAKVGNKMKFEVSKRTTENIVISEFKVNLEGIVDDLNKITIDNKPIVDPINNISMEQGKYIRSKDERDFPFELRIANTKDSNFVAISRGSNRKTVNINEKKINLVDILGENKEYYIVVDSNTKNIIENPKSFNLVKGQNYRILAKKPGEK